MEERVKIFLEGPRPERAVSRLVKGGICVFWAKKTKKNQIMLVVSKKDSEKVFAIYPKVCYNSTEKISYRAGLFAKIGVYRYIHRLFSRIGVVIGLICFFAMVSVYDYFVFSIRYKGEYPNEAKKILSSFGVQKFAVYPKGKEEAICEKLFALEGVSFASVKKSGVTVEVEVRTSPFARPPLSSFDMLSNYTGEVVSLIVLRGTAVKASGFIKKGEVLVGGYTLNEAREKTPAYPVARAEIRVVEEYTVEGEEQPQIVVDGKKETEEIEKIEGGWRVKVVYIAIQSVNL